MFFFSFSQVRAAVIWEIETGGPNSASWQFVEHLALLWESQYPDEQLSFRPKYTPDPQKRLQNLQQGYSQLGIVPSKYYSSLTRSTDLKVVLSLWDTYLLPFKVVLEQEDLIEGEGEDKKLDLTAEVPQLAQKVGFFPSGSFIFSKIEGLNNEFSLMPYEPQKLAQDLDLNDEAIYFYEMAGQIKQLRKTLGYEIELTKLAPKFLRKLKQKNPYLDLLSLPDVSSGDFNTIGFSFVLIGKNNLQRERVFGLVDLILKRKNPVFGKPYVFQLLDEKKTKVINQKFLHPATRDFFQSSLGEKIAGVTQ